MIDYEIKVKRQNENDWSIEVYDPNVWTTIASGLRTFATIGEATCWTEAVGEELKVYSEGEVIYAKVQYGTDLQKLLTTL